MGARPGHRPTAAQPDPRPVRLEPLASLATKQVSVIALRNAAQRGRLKAQRGDDGRWRSTRAWVDEYLGSRYHRGAR